MFDETFRVSVDPAQRQLTTTITITTVSRTTTLVTMTDGDS